MIRRLKDGCQSAFMILLLTVSLSVEVYAKPIFQSNKVDSLLTLAESASEDSLKYAYLQSAADEQAYVNRSVIFPILKEKYGIAQSIGDSMKIASTAEQLGRNYLYASENDSALVYINIALDLFENLDQFQYGLNLNNLALIYQRTNRYEKAIETYQDVVNHSNQINDPIGSIYAYLNLMSISMDLKDEVKAISYYGDIDLIARTIDNADTVAIEELRNVMPSVYLNLGQCYTDIDLIDSSIYYFNKAEASLDLIESDYMKNYVMGYIESSRGDQAYQLSEESNGEVNLLSTALGHFNTALELFEKVDNERGRIFTNNNIGKVLVRMGRLESADRYLENALAAAKAAGFNEEIRDSYEHLANYQEKLGNHQKSLLFYKNYLTYKDSIRNDERDRLKQGLDIRFETADREKKIAELALDKEREIRKQESQRLIYLISFLVFIGLAIALFSRWRYLKQREKTQFEKDLNQAMARFVPTAFIKAIGYDRIQDVQLGDRVEKDVTVVFTDIRGFTTISEGMTPSENFQFVKEYAELMGPIIEKNYGFISQYLGDGIMAIFDRNPTDALIACREMQEEITRFNQRRIDKGLEVIKVGMGMHYGSLIMGIIGDETRRDATLISDTVNTAARIESATKTIDAQILLSEEVAKRLSQEYAESIEKVGDVAVKGKAKPITVYKWL